ncbi:Transcriptional regulator containing an amidase domain and an AraC-type DNA-binding HTH domain [Candidatus Burkholderia humilis]|nr:Transcriptional regulator containing an amidase domain and an AraC-type DNA-binding HTH domain [Candidatus Burkholderia humilis]
MANYLCGEEVFRWSIVSPRGGAVASSSGLGVGTQAISEAGRPDIVFVVGGVNVQRATTPKHLRALRRYAMDARLLGSLCIGAYVLARAGLLSGYACAIHWENLSALKEEFPQTRFLRELFVFDRDRITCSGGVAPLDMMLNLIAQKVGVARVTQIARQLIVERVRDRDAQQHVPMVARLGSANKSLFEVFSLMENNIEEPLSLEELARLAGMSQRHLQRLFSDCVDMSPMHFYMNLRLRRARELLLQTDMSIMDITVACGFRSACHFSKANRKTFGAAPSVERRKQAPAFSVVREPRTNAAMALC